MQTYATVWPLHLCLYFRHVTQPVTNVMDVMYRLACACAHSVFLVSGTDVMKLLVVVWWRSTLRCHSCCEMWYCELCGCGDKKKRNFPRKKSRSFVNNTQGTVNSSPIMYSCNVREATVRIAGAVCSVRPSWNHMTTISKQCFLNIKNIKYYWLWLMCARFFSPNISWVMWCQFT